MLERRDDMKNAMEWVSYGIRRSMARSMFPKFPEGCQGRPFREVYQLNKKLKSGTFSTVCRGVHRATGRQVAVKCILRKKIEPSVDAAVFEEVLIMSGLHHKYICPMIDYFEEDRCHFVVMELERGGDLCERLNEKVTYSEEDARKVLRNICEAMDFVHSRGYAHCDIKPRNYLLRSKRDDIDVRLADFGFAQHVHAPNSLTSQCGTPFFVAPEVINRKPYDQKVDMWSIGVTTYLLLCGDTPFNGKNRQQLFRRISCDEPTFADDKWGNISDEGVDFVRKLLTKDPERRLTADQALSHPWLMMEEKEVPTMAQPRHSSQTDQQTQPKPQVQVSPDLGSLDRRTRGNSQGSSPTASVRSAQTASVRSKTRSASSGALNRYKETASPNKSSVKHNKSRESTNRRERAYSSEKKSVERRSKSKSRGSGSKSRERLNTNHRGAPPQSVKAQARESSASKLMMDSSSNPGDDVNARLLDVIKNQDAKIEQLERLVKRMLDPEGAGHD
ncbi:hypothetical protein ACHAW5_006148 [Stephanodiscus triporus]|uniref:Protein kinase domain-containing protein n=1 Tax=Stephanodiscus triporus TaxID=2934178 RepID=A0ABD3NF53_9STRA